MAVVKLRRGTRSDIDTAAGSSGLVQYEPFLITDENRLGVSLTSSTYETYAKESEAGGGGISVLNKSGTEVTINNSTAETDIMRFSVPGGTLSTNNFIRVSMGGFILNQTGGTTNCDCWLAIKYGATTLYNDVRNTLGNSALGHGFNLTFILAASNSTAAQQLTGVAAIGGNGGTTAGFGDLGSDEIFSWAILGGESSEDSTADKDLAVTIKLDLASANFTFRKFHHVAELL